MIDRDHVKREIDAAIGHGLGVCAVDTTFSSGWSADGTTLVVRVQVLDMAEAVAGVTERDVGRRVGAPVQPPRTVLLDRIVALVREAKLSVEEGAGVVGQALMRVLDLGGDGGEREVAAGVTLVYDTRGQVLRQPSGRVDGWEYTLRVENVTTTRWVETVGGTRTRIEWGAWVRTTDAAAALVAVLGVVAV